MVTKEINIGLIGFGTIGTGVVKILNNPKDIEKKTGLKLNIKKIVDKDITTKRSVEIDPKKLSKNIDDVLNDKEIKIVVELIGGYEPARTYMIKALEKKKHLVTANKAVLSKFGQEIFKKAKENNLNIGFEASVCGAIPIIHALKESLIADNIKAVKGILNGTTNYILTKMSDEKLNYTDALKKAQKKGFAEADPSFDVEGIDAAQKLAILNSIIYNTKIDPDKIYREGITKITVKDIEYAKEFGYVIKLLAIAKEKNNCLELRVHPTLIPEKHPLAAVRNEDNAVYIEGENISSLMFGPGKGAGQMPTANSVVSDVIDIAKKLKNNLVDLPTYSNKKKFIQQDDIKLEYYLHFSVLDKPGVLSSIAGVLAKYNISIASVIQKERNIGGIVPVVMMTHEAKDGNICKALKEIDKLPVIKDKTRLIRIEK